MKIKDNLYYAKTHEWVEYLGESRARVGISDHAQEEMGDIVYIDLPEADSLVDAGDDICVVESVKAVADVYSPLSGKVNRINEELADNPETINSAPYESWLFEIEYNEKNDELLNAEEYEKLLEGNKE